MKAAAWIAAPLALSLLAPTQAEASSCSGSGGSSGSSSSGSSSSSSGSSSSSDWSSSDSSSYSSSSSSSSSTPVCSGDDVLGFRDCKPFGAWGANLRLPQVILSMGTAVRQAPSLAIGKSSSFSHEGESFAYRTVDSGTGSDVDTMMLFTLRLGFGLPKKLYVAADFEFGGLTDVGRTTAEMATSGMRGSPTITPDGGIAVNMLGVVGLRTGSKHASFGVEVAGGVHVASYSFHTQYLACEQYTSVSAAAPLAEIRANVEHWLNPWIKVGANVGGSVIDRGSWMSGLYLGFHTRAFAGER